MTSPENILCLLDLVSAPVSSGSGLLLGMQMISGSWSSSSLRLLVEGKSDSL